MGYMAPEQFQNAKRVGPQADVYAIGVVIFRSVAGRLPFVEPLVRDAHPDEAREPLPRPVEHARRREKRAASMRSSGTALAPHPSSRFDSGHEMLEAWWRVAADIDRDGLFIDGVEVVFEFEDDIEVSTDVVGNKATIGETIAEIEATTVNRHGSGPDDQDEDEDEDTDRSSA